METTVSDFDTKVQPEVLESRPDGPGGPETDRMPLVQDTTGILFVLAANAAFWFLLKERTGWKLFGYVPPLLFIYALPVVFSNAGLIPASSPLYDWMGEALLPFVLVLLLLDVDVGATIRVIGRGIFVMILGTVGIVLGAPIGFLVARQLGLDPEGWRGFGALAGSWIGGTGNMAAVAEGIGTSGTWFGLAVVADTVVYLVWLPLLLQSKNLAAWFGRFSGTEADRAERMKATAEKLVVDKGKASLVHYLYLIAIGSGVTFLAIELAAVIPESPPILSTSTIRILLVTTFGIALSFSPARRIPGSHELAMALIYLFVSRMGAKAVVTGLAGQAVPFLVGAFVWITIHGVVVLFAARLFRIDVHTAAISSAANVGGAASAPVVAAYHDDRLVPVSILMALVGYAYGNYAGFLAASLCELFA